jgi:hypothetical protein
MPLRTCTILKQNCLGIASSSGYCRSILEARCFGRDTYLEQGPPVARLGHALMEAVAEDAAQVLDASEPAAETAHDARVAGLDQALYRIVPRADVGQGKQRPDEPGAEQDCALRGACRLEKRSERQALLLLSRRVGVCMRLEGKDAESPAELVSSGSQVRASLGWNGAHERVSAEMCMYSCLEQFQQLISQI